MAFSAPAALDERPHRRKQVGINRVAAAETQQLHGCTGLQQQALQLDARPMGHHRILLAVGEQHLQIAMALRGVARVGGRLPARMGIAAAGHHSGHRQGFGGGAIAARGCTRCAVQRHGRTLRETQQHRVVEGQALVQVLQTAAQIHQRARQLGPAVLLQVVPLAARAGRVGQGRPQGHQLLVGAHQQLAQVEQVVGIGAPAMQQDQPAAGVLWA